MNIDFDILRYVVLISVAIYFIFDFIDNKRIKDEREELIQLKTYAFIQKLTLGAITILSLSSFYFITMPASFPIFFVILTYMYGEIFGKIYFRKKL